MGPSIAIAMGLAKIVKNNITNVDTVINLYSVLIWSHTVQLIVGFNLLSYSHYTLYKPIQYISNYIINNITLSTELNSCSYYPKSY